VKVSESKWKFQQNLWSLLVAKIPLFSGFLAIRLKQKELLAAQLARAAEHDELSLRHQCRNKQFLQNLLFDLP
jgi:hypothetical protein